MKTLKLSIQPITDKSYNLFRQFVFRSRFYGPLIGAPREKIINFASKIDISEEQAVSIHHLLVKEKIMTSIRRINGNINKISQEYRTIDILKLSYKYDHPPLNLLRSIFINNGYDEGDIYDAFAGREAPSARFRGRDLHQFILAAANDADTVINQQAAARRADVNEQVFVNYFRDMGCNIKTQNDLTSEQMAKHGRAVITPDILFVEPIIINGAQVNWIDFKDYVGTPISFMLRSNVKQYKKYNDHYGAGLVCYRLGFVESVKKSLDAIDCKDMSIPFLVEL